MCNAQTYTQTSGNEFRIRYQRIDDDDDDDDKKQKKETNLIPFNFHNISLLFSYFLCSMCSMYVFTYFIVLILSASNPAFLSRKRKLLLFFLFKQPYMCCMNNYKLLLRLTVTSENVLCVQIHNFLINIEFLCYFKFSINMAMQCFAGMLY